MLNTDRLSTPTTDRRRNYESGFVVAEAAWCEQPNSRQRHGYDECGDVKHCQAKYGGTANPVLVFGEVVRKHPGIVYISSPAILLIVDAWRILDRETKIKTMENPEIRSALFSAGRPSGLQFVGK